MKVLIIGDVHGHWDELNALLLRARDGLGVDAAIQVGDLGIDRRSLDAFSQRVGRFALPLYAIDGNHEDHAFLARAIRSGKSRSWADELNLVVQPRASIAQFGTSVAGFLGGALHVARPQQHGLFSGAPNYLASKHINAAVELFNRVRPDLIVTHSCPAGIGIGMCGSEALELGLYEHVTSAGFDPGPQGDRGEVALRTLWERLTYRPKVWAFGHFHVEWRTQINETTFVCAPAIDAAGPRAVLCWDPQDCLLQVEFI